MFKKYIGTKDFYQKLMRIALPLALSNLLSSCMSIVDSVMVSSIGMVTAVGNATNVMMLNDGILWGVVSGIAIFSSQFFGARQYENMNKSFGLSVLSTFLISGIFTLLIYSFGREILLFYLNDLELVEYSLIYLKISSLSLFPAWFNFCVITQYRSMHNTRFPFLISTGSALGNVILNYIFIFIMKLGIAGAALGSLLSNLTWSIVLIVTIFLTKPQFFYGIKHMFSFNLNFIKPIFSKTIPIVVNETFFGFGSSLFAKAYGQLGTSSMDAYYIANQAYNLFTFAIWGIGNAVAIIVGTTLGAGEIKQASRESYYHMSTSFIMGLSLMLIMILLAPTFLSFYSIQTIEAYELTRYLLYVLSLKVFMRAFNYMMFSVLKAGGDSSILNILDSGIMYLVGIPLAFGSVYFGIKSIVIVLLICQLEQVVRFFFTIMRYRKGYWLKNLTSLVN